MLSGSRLAAAGSAVVMTVIGASGDSVAAVRVCRPAVSSGLQQAPHEQEARARAISVWIKAASAYGQGYTSWRLAVGKRFGCRSTAAGGYECLARAEPCTISQVPPAPDGTMPRRETPGVDG